MKTFFKLMMILFLGLLMAAGAQYAGYHPAAGFAFAVLGTVGMGFITPFLPSGIFMTGLFPDLWTGELIEKFRHFSTFLGRVPKRDNLVKNNTIHLVDIGADPAVLINNTTYPIASAQRTDVDVAITLDKLETENTIITDDELYGLPYDKEGSVLRDHRMSLQQKAAEKSAHSLCPQADSANTPVLKTTGGSNGYTVARKRMTINEIIKAQRLLDQLKVPAEGRELVLSPLHVEDLLMTSQAFKEQWFKIKSGEVLDMFGFLVSKFVANPLFSNSTGEKKAFGAAENASDDLETSFFYYNKRTVQATGTAKMYHAKAADDPKYRQSEVGFRIYHLCLPKKNIGFGAIISDIV